MFLSQIPLEVSDSTVVIKRVSGLTSALLPSSPAEVMAV